MAIPKKVENRLKANMSESAQSPKREDSKSIGVFAGLSVMLCFATGIVSLLAALTWGGSALIAAAIAFGLLANALLRD